MRRYSLPACLFVIVASVGCKRIGQTPTAETNVPSDDLSQRWNLADLYPTDEAWAEAVKTAEARLDDLDACKGTLGESGAKLADCLDLYYGLAKEFSRIYSYAGKRSDIDTRDAKQLEKKQKAEVLWTSGLQKASFFDPEILSLGREKVEAFIASEPRLKIYAHPLDNTLRQAPHTLDAAGEKLLAASNMISETPSSLYRVFTNAELPWPTITLSDQSEVRLDQSGYTKNRSRPNRADRKAVFAAFWGKLAEYQQTLGVALYSQLKKDLFYTQSRNYPTCLARALGADNVPETVYRTLVKTTNDNLATLHRYFALRGRMLGIDDLGYHDIYPPLVSTDLKFPIARGQELVLTSLAPLGEDYVATVKKGFGERWMDTFPRQGKRSGAYSSGAAYDVHPYVLMNYNDDYESVSTLAHEWGHTMHSHLANTKQPYPTSDYAIFVAEVASTFNEGLLLDHVLKTAKSDDEKLYYLGSALEGLRGTFYRQTMFAEYELKIHEEVEKGEALSGERFTEIYRDLLERYHGHDAGVMNIDDAYAIEWAYIPHFYYNFYVYKYATSIAAGSLFVKDVLGGKAGARDRYLAVLEAGGSEYPYELLKEAGVDLATEAPYEALVARMNTIMDEIEVILNRRG